MDIVGVVQHYDWGDTTTIPSLLGRPPDGRPWAEWWLGTHPTAPSTSIDGQPLQRVSGTLPYLVKVLAAAHPLSLQTHPSAEQAATGFAREERDGPPIDHPDRIYRDPFAKPELLCALTPFDALCGFRDPQLTVALLDDIGCDALADTLREVGIAATFAAIYRDGIDLVATVAACATSPRPEAALVRDLGRRYPADPSVVATLLLNRVLLQPGQAIFLDAGNVHAYLHGAGVEVMGASDNVVRCGLTSKHIDIEELLRVVHAVPLLEPVVPAIEEDPGRWRYPVAGVPFSLQRRHVSQPVTHRAAGREVWLCVEGPAQGRATYLSPDDELGLAPGTWFGVSEDDQP